jgi:hypothetical protein
MIFYKKESERIQAGMVPNKADLPLAMVKLNREKRRLKSNFLIFLIFYKIGYQAHSSSNSESQEYLPSVSARAVATSKSVSNKSDKSFSVESTSGKSASASAVSDESASASAVSDESASDCTSDKKSGVCDDSASVSFSEKGASKASAKSVNSSSGKGVKSSHLSIQEIEVNFKFFEINFQKIVLPKMKPQQNEHVWVYVDDERKWESGIIYRQTTTGLIVDLLKADERVQFKIYQKQYWRPRQ